MSGDVVLKVDRFESHDRLLEYSKQKDYISEGVRDCIAKRPEEFGNHPFYIYAHLRTHDNGYTKRLIWEPRLTKPTPQTNSMLFKAYPPTDKIKICWMIPPREQWGQYRKGFVTENDVTENSIWAFQNDRESLQEREYGDLEDWQINDIYTSMANNLRFRQVIEAASIPLI